MGQGKSRELGDINMPPPPHANPFEIALASCTAVPVARAPMHCAKLLGLGWG